MSVRRPLLQAHVAAVYNMVERIPSGYVATYGQIAELAGLGRGARFVGRALKHAPPELAVPWHRVVNARGTLSFPHGSEPYCRQRDLLEKEGVVFVQGRIQLSRYRWQPTLDQLMWESLMLQEKP